MIMEDINSTPNARAGDLAQLVSPTNKIFIIRLEPGEELHTHRGILHHDDLIGQPWGSQIFTHLGKAYFLLQPSLSDVLRDLKRNTQIMYPKDIGFVLVTMGIGPGVHVVEAGTGSGALTIAMAWAVGETGRVTSYDQRLEMQNLARKNLERLGFLERVTLKQRDIAEGFDEQNVDALFLDVPNPYDYLLQARRALKPGGYFGTILPTVNQITRLLDAFYQYDYAFVDVCEIMLRYYKTVAERFRPTDRMVAHTGYLAFARPMLESYKKSEPLAASDAELENLSEEDIEKLADDEPAE
jgi:tRNA (adenine57-N1/adenine58-N1)-methyltransferase catalytic subunit